MAESVEETDESITCSVCLEIFRVPKVLPCGHSFCLEPCLKHLTATTVKSKKIDCPLCRTRVSLPKSRKPQDFPTNFSLQSILESKKRKRSTSSSSFADSPFREEAKRAKSPEVPPPQCTHLKEAQLYCEHCQHFLCTNCAEQYHGNHLHNIIAKDTAMELARSHSEQLVRDRMSALEQRLTKLRKLHDEGKMSSVNYNNKSMDLKHEVWQQMNIARKAIDKREREYLQTIGEQTEADKTLYEQFNQKWAGVISSEEQQLNSLREILAQVQSGNLTSMGQVMNVLPIDVSCSAMTEEKQTRLLRSPPFEIVNGLPDHFPKLHRM